MLIYSLALFVLLGSSLPWVAMAKPMNKSAWLMTWYLIASANVILTCYIANSFYLLNRQWVILAIHTLIGGLGWLLWNLARKPSLGLSLPALSIKSLAQGMRHEPVLALLTLSMSIAYAFALVQVIFIPQNNIDSLSTYLSRMGFWLQHGSFFPWPTIMLNQIWYPVNAQLQSYWTILFLGSDRLAGSSQWLAALISAVGVFSLARFWGYNSRQSSFAALVYLGFPLIVLQSTTTQTDLTTVAFFIPAVYFLILGIREGRVSLLTLSAIGAGLGIGVKKSYFLLLPVLAVIALLAMLEFRGRSWKLLLIWSINLVAGIALLGSYIYISNWHYLGNPFGSPTYIDSLLDTNQGYIAPRKVMLRPTSSLSNESSSMTARVEPPSRDFLLEVVYNVPRLFYQALDTSGLPRPLDGYAHKVKMRLIKPVFQFIGFDEIEGTAYTAPGHVFSFSDKNINEESHAWYGPLSVLLLFPALIIGAWRGIKFRSYLMSSPLISALIFLPMEIILRPGWDPFQGRYFAPLVALGAPLMAMWFKEKGNAVREWLISVLAVVIVTVTLLYNPSKPTLGKYADDFHVWNNDRIFIQTIQRKNNRNVYYMVEKFVPANSTLGYYIPFFFLDYPLFGEKLNRQLVPINSPFLVSDTQWLRVQGVKYLLLPKGEEYPIPDPEYHLIGKVSGWGLYEYSPQEPSPQ